MDTISVALSTIGAHGGTLAAGTGFFLVSLAGAVGVSTYVLVRLPEDYLTAGPEAAHRRPSLPVWKRRAAKVGKNLLGVVLVGGGIAMAIPGVPGPGVLTTLAGLSLLDIPGKRRFEKRILGAPKVLALVNRLRARFGRAPVRPGSPRRSAP